MVGKRATGQRPMQEQPLEAANPFGNGQLIQGETGQANLWCCCGHFALPLCFIGVSSEDVGMTFTARMYSAFLDRTSKQILLLLLLSTGREIKVSKKST